MKYFLLLLIAAFVCCQENATVFDPNDASNLEGKWVDMTGTLPPDWHYDFHNGLLTQSYVNFGSIITSLSYPYAYRGDTVFIGGDATNTPRMLVVYFECEDVVKVNHLGAMINHQFWLKRE